MLIDSHAHLDLPEFDEDREEMLARARAKGVTAIIGVGIDVASSGKSLEIAKAYPAIFTTVGFHPNESHEMKAGDIQRLAGLAGDSKVVAIGEIGLDYYRHYAPRESQITALKQQLELAVELRLPVVIHSRDSHKDTWEILSHWAKSTPPVSGSPLRGVIHCFSGDEELGRRYIELGFMISLAGSVTYPKAVDRVAVARALPMEKLLVETDAPFLPPQNYRGKRNEPSYVTLVAEKIAQIKGLPVDAVARTTAQNTIELFRLPGIV